MVSIIYKDFTADGNARTSLNGLTLSTNSLSCWSTSGYRTLSACQALVAFLLRVHWRAFSHRRRNILCTPGAFRTASPALCHEQLGPERAGTVLETLGQSLTREERGELAYVSAQMPGWLVEPVSRLAHG